MNAKLQKIQITPVKLDLEINEYHIYAKEHYGSTTQRTLHFETPLRVNDLLHGRPALNDWVRVTLLNKLRHPMGALEMETSELITELTKVIEMLKEG